MQTGLTKAFKYQTLKNIILINSLGYFIYAIINLSYGRYVLAIFEGCVFIINIIIVINFNKITKLYFTDKFVALYTLLLLAILLITMSNGTIYTLSYIWVFMVPFMAYVNGVRFGFFITSFVVFLTIIIYFLKSKSGYHPVNPLLLINFSVSFLSMWAMIHKYEKIKSCMTDQLIDLSITDRLTNLRNRSQLYEVYSHYQEKMTILTILDVDSLKNINNKYGYLSGDVVLMNIASIISQYQKIGFHCFRIGDDEFAILMTKSNWDDCIDIAKNIFAEITACKTPYKGDIIKIKISMAITCIESDGHNLDRLMEKANILLQKAKHSKTDKLKCKHYI